MSDTRTIVVSIVGTGLATTTVIVAFTAIIASGIDARFDDVNTRIDDVNRNLSDRTGDVNTRIDDVNRNLSGRIDDVNRNLSGRIDDLDTRMDKIEADIRELRTLTIEAIGDRTGQD